MNTIIITPTQLTFCLVFVLITAICSILLKLKLEKDIFFATLRTFSQLLLLGFVLKYVFALNNPPLILLMIGWMILWAALTAKSRLKNYKIPIFRPVLLSMFLSTYCIIIITCIVILNVKPWYSPQYLIPLGGMLIGNSMNAIAVAIERLLQDFKNNKDQIILQQCLGANYKEASQEILKKSIKAGLIPIINTLMSVGLVSMPGMMTGQILAGANPMDAVKYQIMIMLMILVSCTINTILSCLIIRKLCFCNNELVKF